MYTERKIDSELQSHTHMHTSFGCIIHINQPYDNGENKLHFPLIQQYIAIITKKQQTKKR